jgi:chromosomal replication initiator protein
MVPYFPGHSRRGHYAQSLYDGARVRYVSSEEFTNDFINSIRDHKADGFRFR